VDASVEMTRVARERIQRAGIDDQRVQFSSVPIIQFESENKFDLIVTQFFLDCFANEELRKAIEKLASFLMPGGAWMVADFQVPSGGWRRRRAQLVLALAYAFFRIATRLPAKRLVAPQPLLEAQGLQLEKRIEFNFGLLYAEQWKKR
jgi:ubiquinone/menaquinone biosynthesis C-methylase UbiE